MADPIPTPKATPPDIVRAAYMDLVVTDLKASRRFYVDVLGLVVTEEDEDVIHLRSLEEFIHHNLVLRKGPIAAVAALAYRVRTPEDLDRAVDFYTELGCRVVRARRATRRASTNDPMRRLIFIPRCLSSGSARPQNGSRSTRNTAALSTGSPRGCSSATVFEASRRCS